MGLLRTVIDPEDWVTPEDMERRKARAREFLAEEDQRSAEARDQLRAQLGEETGP